MKKTKEQGKMASPFALQSKKMIWAMIIIAGIMAVLIMPDISATIYGESTVAHGLSMASTIGTVKTGFSITTSNNFTNVTKITKHSNVIATNCYLTNTSLQIQSTGVFVGDDCSLPSKNNTMLNSTTYYILVDKAGASYTYYYGSSGSLPVVTSPITWVNGYGGGDDANAHSIVSIGIAGQYNINFSICNAVINSPYINYSFKDELTGSFIKSNITASTFNYWADTTNNQTYSYSNTSVSLANYSFCYTPPAPSVNVSQKISYSATGYPQRNYDFTEILSSTTALRTLYLLPSSSGIYVTFQVINLAEQSLEGTFVSVNRTIGSSTANIGNGYTGTDGSITFFLNPDFSHTFTFIKEGYETYVTSFMPTQSSYTIQLSGGETGNTTDLSQGISVAINPTGYYLNNQITYNFNMTLNSTFWIVNFFGFNVTNESGYLINKVNGTTNGGYINTTVNTGNQSRLILTYFWVIDGNNLYATKTYIVWSDYYTQWSIKNFFDRFVTYANLNMFGLTSFGKSVIAFLIILTFTGVLTFKYGFTSLASITGAIFAMVLMLDVGLNFVPNPVGAIPHFATILTALIFTAMLFKEATQ